MGKWRAQIHFSPMAGGKGWTHSYVDEFCGITAVMGALCSISTVYVVTSGASHPPEALRPVVRERILRHYLVVGGLEGSLEHRTWGT